MARSSGMQRWQEDLARARLIQRVLAHNERLGAAGTAIDPGMVLASPSGANAIVLAWSPIVRSAPGVAMAKSPIAANRAHRSAAYAFC